MARGRRNRGGGGGAGGGGRRGRGTVSTDDIQRVAETVREAAARHGIQITDMGTGGWSPQMQFLLACEDGDIDRLKVVVDNMDEDDRESLASVRMGGSGPLHSAASSGNVEMCKYLVEQLGFHVDSDADNHDSGVTPLYCAAMEGKVVTAKYFLDKGADPNNKDSKGLAPLHEAAAAGYDAITRLLLSNGADVDVSSPEGTPLVVAAAHGKFSVMKILLEHHADPNKVSWKFGTPLTTTLYATSERMDEPTCLKCMKLLVKAGADVNCTIPETPLVIATSRGLTKCAEYLLEVCTKANGPVNDDNTTDKDRKARLKSSGAKAVERKDYATA
ncbi:hypothetical protein BRADI_1g12543v3 [Brachypodium distachyon]|uniref:Uncharacterized protein n=1 Tax=Brachypodium distachyon TaxID=15368 RepID=A0A0Q3RLL9_BRADI|nr:hypothetical protein BRADI_1g12543v3 [Brachypodium distachyon]